MADYTLTNLKEIEDQAPKFGLAPNLEARFARKPLEADHLGVSYQRLAPDFRVPFGHKHGEQEEIYVLLSGSARLKLDEEIVELRAVGRGSRRQGHDAELRGRPERRRDPCGRRRQERNRGRRDDAGLVAGLI